MNAKIDIPMDKIKDFCQRWKIVEFSLFGSVLREDFRPDSDVDVLVTFAADAKPKFGEYLDMLDELKAIFGRDVDLAQQRLLKNPYRRHEILKSRELIYAA